MPWTFASSGGLVGRLSRALQSVFGKRVRRLGVVHILDDTGQELASLFVIELPRFRKAVVIFQASSTRVNSTCMATAFTHAFVASALGAARPRGVSPLKVAVVLSAVAVLPDVDVLAFRLGIPYEHPLGHRGLTHSLPFAAVVGMLTPWLWFREVPRFTRAWWVLALLSFLAGASHGVLDALTDAGRGVGFFLPFTDGRYFVPWRPLETSPVSPITFFRGRSLEILANELLWVWLPVGLVWMAVHRARAR